MSEALPNLSVLYGRGRRIHRRVNRVAFVDVGEPPQQVWQYPVDEVPRVDREPELVKAHMRVVDGMKQFRLEGEEEWQDAGPLTEDELYLLEGARTDQWVSVFLPHLFGT